MLCPSLVLSSVWSSWSPHAQGLSTRPQPARIYHESQGNQQKRLSTRKAFALIVQRRPRRSYIDFSTPSISPSPRDSPDADRFFTFEQCAVTDLGSQFSYRNTKSSTCARRREKSSSTSPSYSNSRLRSRFVVCIHEILLPSLYLNGKADR